MMVITDSDDGIFPVSRYLRHCSCSALRIMMEEWQRDGEKTGLMMIKQTEYYVGETKHLKIYEDHPNVSDIYRRFG